MAHARADELAVALGMRMLPMFFIGVPAGALADRFPRDRLLMLTGAGQAFTTATLGGFVLTGTVTPAHVLLLTLAAGTFRALEHAARQSATAHATLRSAPAPSVWQGTLGFLVAVRRDPVLFVLMMLTAGAEVLGFAHQALLPSLARDILHVGPEGLGALSAARSVGGILGLAAAAGGATAAGGARCLAVLVAFGAGLIVLGVAPYAGWARWLRCSVSASPLARAAWRSSRSPWRRDCCSRA